MTFRRQPPDMHHPRTSSKGFLSDEWHFPLCRLRFLQGQILAVWILVTTNLPNSDSNFAVDFFFGGGGGVGVGTCGDSCDCEFTIFENAAITIAIFWDAKLGGGGGSCLLRGRPSGHLLVAPPGNGLVSLARCFGLLRLRYLTGLCLKIVYKGYL